MRDMGSFPERILIIKPSSLGDIIHALPALDSLRKRFPDSWIAWVVKREFQDIVVDHPMLNEVLTLDPGVRGWWALAKKLRKGEFDLAIDLQGLFRSASLTWWSGASERVGFAAAREGGRWFYSSQVRIPGDDQIPWRLLNVHAVDRNLAIVRHCGAPAERPHFEFPPLHQDRQSIAVLLKAEGVSPENRLVVIAPGGRLAIKRWPVERFVQVAQSLIQDEGVKIIVVGALSDLECSRHLEALPEEKCINLIGKTGIGQLVALLDRADLLIANDSAPIHIAVALQTPVLAILGPTNRNATGPYPFGREQVIARSLSCSPCGQRQCHNSEYMECLRSISPEEVGCAAQGLLAMK